MTALGSAGRDRRTPLLRWRGPGLALGYFELALLIIGLITAARIVVLFTADYDLGPDEAQYWSWAQHPAFGYFSKPPMIAWLIALSTALVGDGEAAVRLPAPLLHMATSLVVYALARDLYDQRTAFWSALIYATAPAVWFSSGLITTDVPLLLFWALALLALRRTLDRRSMVWAIVLGIALGLGFLSKYAMLYFLLCAGLYLGLSAEHRWMLWGRRALVALVVAGVIAAPNILWNLNHGLSTVEHTAANANWGANLFNPGKLLEFIGAQLGVFGPLLFGALIWGMASLRKRLRDDADLFLVCFVLPILAVVTLQAFVSRANANWAVPAYVAAAVLVVAWLRRARRGWWIVPTSVAVHTSLAAVLCALILSPALVEALGRSNDFKRVHGWHTLGAAVAEVAAAGHDGRPYSALLTNDRLVHAELLYYARPHRQPVVTWEPDGNPGNHYELTSPFTPDLGGNVLLVSRYPEAEVQGILSRFRSYQPLSAPEVPLGGSRTRTLYLFAAADYRG